MLTIDGLKKFGANTEEGLGRCMKNEMLYLRLVGMVVNDQNYGKLSAAIEAGDLKAGFEAAHALKGVLGNLSLTPIYEPVSKLTEMLRHPENGEDYRPLYDEVMKQKALLEELSGKGA